MCDDVNAFIAELTKHQIACDPVRDQGDGLFTQLTLPGGGKLGVYQPRHARPLAMNQNRVTEPLRLLVERTRREMNVTGPLRFIPEAMIT